MPRPPTRVFSSGVPQRRRAGPCDRRPETPSASAFGAVRKAVVGERRALAGDPSSSAFRIARCSRRSSSRSSVPAGRSGLALRQRACRRRCSEAGQVRWSSSAAFSGARLPPAAAQPFRGEGGDERPRRAVRRDRARARRLSRSHVRRRTSRYPTVLPSSRRSTARTCDSRPARARGWVMRRWIRSARRTRSGLRGACRGGRHADALAGDARPRPRAGPGRVSRNVVDRRARGATLDAVRPGAGGFDPGQLRSSAGAGESQIDDSARRPDPGA